MWIVLSLGANAITSLRLCKLECDVEFRRGEFSSSNSNWKVMLLRLFFSWLRWFLLGPRARCHTLPSVTSCQRRIDQRTHTECEWVVKRRDVDQRRMEALRRPILVTSLTECLHVTALASMSSRIVRHRVDQPSSLDKGNENVDLGTADRRYPNAN